ncbi:MAG: Ig-like domain-containing protein [Verrucomicrobiota bacterium]
MNYNRLFLTLITFTVSISAVRAQEVFRESTYTYGAPPTTHFAELDPDTKRVFTGEHAGMATMKRHVPKPLTLDVVGAVRAELSVEYWGGHIGTAGQRFRVNEHSWIDLPQPLGTPTEPQRFHRTLLGNNAAPIPLDQLRSGENIFRFTAGQQIAFRNDWGFYWIYDFTTRVYYDAMVKPHPAGEIISPKEGSTFDDILRLEVTASSPNGSIARVEFIGEYDDFDWDGDGVWREWQYSTHHGVLQHHLGTVTSAPWRLKYDARWLPDQVQPIRVRARITDATGITYLTPPIGNIVQKRIHRGVRMIKPVVVPEKWMSRAGKESPKGTINVSEGDLVGATFARLVLSTWSGDVEDTSVHELRLNGERLAGRFGEFHNYDQDALEVPLGQLRAGRNEVSLFSTFMGHMFEINWPGPVLLIEYKK